MAIDNLKQFREDIEYVLKYDMIKEAVLLIDIINREFISNESFAADGDNTKYLNKLKWVALSRLENKEVLNLFKNQFTTIFELDSFDIWEKLKSKLILDINVDERDNFKENIKKSLRDNQEKITSQKIMVNDDLVNPTISNWLKDYRISVGSDRFESSEKRNEYLSYNENIKKITKEEKEKIRILLDFYDKLSISSLTKEGYEEGFFISDNEIRGLMIDGVFVKIDKQTEQLIKEAQKIIDSKPLNNKILSDDSGIQDEQLKELLKKYKAGSLEQKAIEEELNKKAK